MSKKNIFFLILSIILISSICEIKAAGPPGPPMGGGTPACWPPPCSIPLDGGISFLIAAGVALAGKKIHDVRKKSA